MAIPSLVLIDALRTTTRNLSAPEADYSWSHMGRCNCGQLAQVLTGRSAADIHRRALTRRGDWTEQARDYCPGTGMEWDAVWEALLEVGLTRQDIAALERLSDREVLKRLPEERRSLQRNRREDVIAYLTAWADLLDERLPQAAGRPSREGRETAQAELRVATSA